MIHARYWLVAAVCILLMGSIPYQEAPLPPGAHRLGLTHDGRERVFRVYVPERSGDDALPLVILMHGAGGNGEGLAYYTRFDELAEAHRFIAAYPDGVNNIWNDGRASDSRVPSGLDDVGFIAAMIDDLAARLNLDQRRVYAAGHSMGGMMAFRLGCELQEKIAAIASVASTFPGYLLETCSAAGPMPVLVIQGTADTVIPWDGVRQGGQWIYLSAPQTAIYWSGHNDCAPEPALVEGLDLADDNTLVLQVSYSQCANNADVVIFGIINGGHTWPGSPARTADLTSYELHASAAIWQFFQGHSLP